MADQARARSNSPSPKSVRRQAHLAERIHEQIYKPAKPEGEAEAPETEASPEALAAGSAAPEQPPQPPQPPQPAPQPAPEPEPLAAQQAPEAPPKQSEATWEQKYRTLDGMIERVNKDKRLLSQQIDGLQATIAALTSVNAEAPDKGNGAAKTAKRLRQEDVDAYGEDMINVIRAAAVDEVQPLIAQLREENAQLKGQLGGVEKRSVQNEDARVESFLTTHVPEWQQVNADPDFHAWLREPDQFAGIPRQTLLNQAGTAFDAPRIAAFFKAYLNENRAIHSHQQPAAAAAPQPTGQAQQERTPAVDMTSLVAPGRPAAQSAGARAAPDGTEDQRVYSQAQITAFYRQVQQGKYEHNPKEKDRIERSIHRAAMSGRVTA